MTAPVPPTDRNGADQNGAATPKQLTTTAGLWGAGGGTGLVTFVDQIVGAETVVGAVLLYLTPAFSIALGVSAYYLPVLVARYIERRDVNRARRTLEQQLDNPRLSEAYKRKIRKKLEELEESVAAAELGRIGFFPKVLRTSQPSTPPATTGGRVGLEHGSS